MNEKPDWMEDFEVLVITTSTVLCDLCNKDWTNSDVSGGFLFLTTAVCPDCSDTMLANIAKYGEEKFIRSTCPIGISFYDYVMEIRQPK